MRGEDYASSACSVTVYSKSRYILFIKADHYTVTFYLADVVDVQHPALVYNASVFCLFKA